MLIRCNRFTHSMGLGLLLTPLFSLADEVPGLFYKDQEKSALLAAIIEQDIPGLLQLDSNDHIEIIDSNNDTKRPPQSPEPVKVISINLRTKMEVFNLRNKKLRHGDKRENELAHEPSLRMNVGVMENNPIYGRAEIEWQRKTKRKSAAQPERQTKLELNQAYVGLTEDIIPYTHLRLGRWLYRDEREWLFDENLDGVVAQSKLGDWHLEALGGRVNYWQKDLLDSSTRSFEPVNIGSLILRKKIASKWQVGAYTVAQYHGDNHDRQLNIGLRSHNPAKKGLQHWFELGMSEKRQSDSDKRGYAVDLGGTYRFEDRALKPRVTLGYAFGSQDYRQTGLHSNEATLGGGSKFKIYGETLNPDLTNIHIFTASLGMDLSQQATLDVVYHRYHQARLSDFANNQTDLSSKYDRQNTRYLGSGVDMVLGWKPTDNTKVEAIVGMFSPSKRFTSASSPHSPRSENAYSIGLEAELRF
ncbi:alginate export family protein [Serratia silvae]|uniref:Alginate export family protein n=1 Tax=Serratia silvae TaxID=2824122 RepID=A0ABT0KB56_9GAMM|nr:alginate export family protein [Serratia silvae]MCL1028969.1 alginate export family protein [Serratia silvae]